MSKEEKEIKPRHGTASFERREYPRFHADLPIEYYRIDSPIGHAGEALNISEGGLLVYFPELMGMGQYIRLKLFFPLGSGLNTIEVLAKVVGVDIYKGWRDYRCGVNFIDVPPRDMTKLRDFIGNLSG